MNGSVFLDTNVLVYLYSRTETKKREINLSLLKKYPCITSTQALNEFTNVHTKKYKTPRTQIRKLVEGIVRFCQIQKIEEETIYTAIYLNEKYGYAYYDCLMLASALHAGCNLLFSEDMQNGQIIEQRYTIVNPFSNTEGEKSSNYS